MSTTPEGRREAAETWELVRQAARTGAYDWYVSALLGPREARDDFLTLAAFAGEIGRIPHLVSEPMMGAVRLQWWRDSLISSSGALSAQASGSPLAEEVARMAARRGLPAGLLLALIDAQEIELQPDPPEDDAALANHFGKAWGTLFQLGATVVGGGGPAPERDVVHAAARAYGFARLANDLAAGRRADRQSLVPTDWASTDGPDVVARMSREARSALGEFRALQPRIAATQRAAFLPVALVEPYLHASQGLVSGRTRGDGTPSALSRNWRMLWAHLKRRV